MKDKKTFIVELNLYTIEKKDAFFSRYEKQGISKEKIQEELQKEFEKILNTEAPFVGFSNWVFKKEKVIGYLVNVYKKKWWQ